MDFLTKSNLENPLHGYGPSLCAAATCFLLYTWIRPKSKLSAIPSIDGDSVMKSYFGAFKWYKDSKGMLQEGYRKYKGSIFKVPNLTRWLVVVSGPKLVEELRQAPEDELSFKEATLENFAVNYTFGSNVHSDPYHVAILRNQLTRNLDSVFSAVRDEIIQAFENAIPATNEWTKVSASHTFMRVVCQISNRLFVGLPLCRDSDWQELNMEFSVDVVKGATVINMFPNFLKPLVAVLFTKVNTKIKRGMKHLTPMIEVRQRCREEFGKDWDDKPNDVLSWFMEERPTGKESTIRNLTLRILTINFAAISTTAMSFTHAMYHLAAMPHYIQPLREEVEAVVRKEGWTKVSMGRLRKLDSFLKETQRFTGLGSTSMMRKAVKDYTFSDGTVIPKGTHVCVASDPTHHDEEYYSNPEVFDGFRFADTTLSEAESVRQQMVVTSLEYIAFGHGRQACPGRFFAASELKAMMAHLLLTYDIKLVDGGPRPADFWFASHCIPNQQGEILFRERQT